MQQKFSSLKSHPLCKNRFIKKKGKKWKYNKHTAK